MVRLSKCAVGGGSSCKRQGGDGSTFHKSGFVHPIPSIYDGIQVGDPCSPITKSLDGDCVALLDLEEDFDDDMAKALLSVDLSLLFDSNEYIAKSLYDIDLDSPEGITKVLALLPILDPEIVKMIYSDIFPGYDASKMSPRIMRIEIRGFLMDSLEAAGERPEGSNETPEDSVSQDDIEGRSEQEAVPNEANEPGTSETAGEGFSEAQPTP